MCTYRVYAYLGENATDEDIDEMIKMCDQDGDGQIAFDEFARMIFRHSGPPKVVKKPHSKLLSPKEQEEIISKKVTKKKLAPIVSNINSYEHEQNKALSPKVMTVKERTDRAFVLRNMIKQIHFESKNIDELHDNFLNECDDQKTGGIKYESFCKAIKENAQNPICQALFKLFQPNTNQQIDFREFLISVIHIITTNQSLKIKYAFNIFDVDGNGSIDRSELLQILKSTHMATNNEQVESKATAIFRQIDVDGNGLLSLDEFQAVTKKFPNLIFPTLNQLK